METPKQSPEEMPKPAVEDNGNLTDFQVEAESKTKEIEVVRNAAEIVREKLGGLGIGPIPAGLEDRLKQVGLMTKDGALSIEDVKGKYDLVAQNTGVSTQILKELVEREESIRYLLKSHPGGFLDRDILSNASFTSLRTQIEFKEQQIKLLEEAKRSLDGSANSGAAMEQVAMRYGMEFLGPDLLEQFKKSGLNGSNFVDTVPKNLLIKRIAEMHKAEVFFKGIYGYTLENSRTGIDPGALCLFPGNGNTAKSLALKNRETSGGFLTPDGFTDEYLSKTGLILLPKTADLTTLAHEYAHFEDEILYKNDRNKLARKLKEVATYLSELEVTDSFYKKELPEVSQEEVLQAEYKFLDGVINSVPKMGCGAAIKNSREEERKIDRNMKKSFQTARYLHENGLSWGAIKSMTLHAKSFKDFLKWEKISKEDLAELKQKNSN